MPTVDTLGTLHTYDLTGELTRTGESLVFIHGWLLSRAYWQPLAASLAADYRCLTYDLRGFGDSTERAATPESAQAERRFIHLPSSAEKTEVPAYSLAAYAQDLGWLLDCLGLDNVWLVGHSLGGSIALWAAYLLGDRIKGVLCVNAGGGIYIPDEFEKFRAAGQQMVKFRPAWLLSVPLLPQVFARLMVNRPLEANWGKQRLQDFIRANRQAAIGALLESTTCEEVNLLPQVVAQLTQPVHFITASQDRVMLPQYVRYLASFHPHFGSESLVSELSDCGHMAMVEQTEAVAEIIRSVVNAYGFKAHSDHSYS
ncbi:MAG: alpha/beta hydrolase [Phormidesmis sp.]